MALWLKPYRILKFQFKGSGVYDIKISFFIIFEIFNYEFVN